MIEQRCDVRSKLLEGVGVSWRCAHAVTAQIVKQNAKSVRQQRKLVSPDIHTGRQRMTQYDHRAVLIAVKRVSEFMAVNRCRLLWSLYPGEQYSGEGTMTSPQPLKMADAFGCYLCSFGSRADCLSVSVPLASENGADPLQYRSHFQ